MKASKSTLSSTASVGELLVRAKQLSSERGRECVSLAKQIGMPVRQIVIYSGDITRHQMLVALELHAMLAEGLLNVADAVAALKYASEHKVDYKEALEKTGFTARKQGNNPRLGDLLIAAGLFAPEDLERAVRQSRDVPCPLGHALIQLGLVSPDVLGLALKVQKALREKRIRSLEEAARKLRAGISSLKGGVPSKISSSEDDAEEPEDEFESDEAMSL